MSTPVATVADALIAFIMSLLRDPAAVEEFDAAPKAALASNGLQDACVADVQAVKPVIVDNPTVMVKHAPPPPPPPPPSSYDPADEVIKEIRNIVNQFTTIDARTTIVDQSTNQNIWTNGGDVTQIFDQEAVVASGDEAVAAGDDATFVDSEVDVTVGDVSVGNTTNDGSFNNTGTDAEADAALSTPDAALTTADEPTDTEAWDAAAIAGDAVETAVDAATDGVVSALDAPVPDAPVDAPVEQPADLLSTDLTVTDVTYESDAAASAVAEEPLLEEPTEEQ